ncbi:Bidirectional sugar transporter SWEET3a [Phytophthora citrophthora]|uniref:Sugar transporter SWEET1 n=1 Tax=Phytophthora citrophthora TaxID=4793 RepID=A0AAD9LFQ6_9STRA|nr:Bidirectional sugar transporter SWEET3a [Phytophthora citrophthora]
MATQLFGMIAAIVFTVVYYRWAVDRPALNRLLVGGLVLCAFVTLYIVLGVAGVTNQNDDQVGTTLGYGALVTNLWMYASPLGTIRQVIKTKSAASLPINISIMLLFNTILWVTLSIVDNDGIIMSLNITGILLAVTQITVYMRYRPNKSIIVHEDVSNKQISVIISPTNGVAPVKSPAYHPLASPIEKTID